MMRYVSLTIACVFMLLFAEQAHSANRIGRLGIGTSSQLKNDIPAISFKRQNSQSTSVEFLFNYSSNDSGGYGIGFKGYKNLFDEPQLNFYMAAMAAYLSKTSATAEDATGFQLDLTMGSEFNFAGLDSIGFSFEFGVSVYQLTDFIFETVGNNFIVAGIHFYL